MEQVNFAEHDPRLKDCMMQGGISNKSFLSVDERGDTYRIGYIGDNGQMLAEGGYWLNIENHLNDMLVCPLIGKTYYEAKVEKMGKSERNVEEILTEFAGLPLPKRLKVKSVA